MSARYVCLEHPEEAGPGGYWACVEIAGAYSDGSSRHDRVWVPGALNGVAGVRAAAIVAAHDLHEAGRERVRGERSVRGLDLDDFKRLRAAGRTQDEALQEAKRRPEPKPAPSPGEGRSR
jgi:hypothetical protein